MRPDDQRGMTRIEPGDYVSPEDAAELLGVVSASTIRRWIARGRLPALRTPGGRLLIYRQDLLLVLEPAGAEIDG